MPLDAQPQSHRFCIAPMLDLTDRHARYFLRLISKHCRLYTEMINTGAIVHGDTEHFLQFSEQENPIALQLGGSNLDEIAKACAIAERYNYDEINLNIGCPSDRVQSGRFGACLMKEAEHVARCIEVMQKNSTKLITIKCRTGVDELDSFEFLQQFIKTTANAGCDTFIIHARKAWLSGLSPKENREIPPLDHSRVAKIKALYPHLTIITNGGLATLDECKTQLESCDGVMVGREAYNNPYVLAQVDQQIFDAQAPVKSRFEILDQLYPYIEQQLAQGIRLHHITRHVFGLFHGQPNGRVFRRHLSDYACKPEAGIEVLQQAAALVNQVNH